ncbi:hypothetical protein CBR_g38010 [Chara braunii]|uniref:Uncharacterized protein n=1 Tax=Chara braunii TaxID=69332 RepID=A0A388K024_CHABU|nr:hypothetical protein CBR_g38010 [Chara braunii]|eukprot:GBG63388.1 hypothetical protein CBR_g38010 [Chara braunii]
METEVIVSGLSPGSEVNEMTVLLLSSGGGTTTSACEEVFATIYMETEQMLADVDDNDSGARGNNVEIEKVGGERNEEDVGSEGPHIGCIVTDANVTKTMAGDRYPYDVNWVPGRVQPGIVGGVHCFAFKVADQWVAVPAPKKETWRNVCLSFIYERVLRLNDGAPTHDACRYAMEMYRVLQAKDREATADEKEAVTFRPRDAHIFDPPLGNPVELALAEGTVFGGEKSITYVHVRGKEATFDGICMDVWDHVAMRKDVVATSNIAAHVIQEGQLYQHVGRDMYGYHVNWVVPGSLHPAVVDGKVTLAARMQSDTQQREYVEMTSSYDSNMIRVVDDEPRQRRADNFCTTIMSMSSAQARTTIKEVMQYAEEDIHYDDDGELRLLTERVPSYFDVRVNIRASIAANGEESLRSRMLLARFTEAHDLRVDNTADSSAYSLRKVVGWMCTEGMSDEGDVDMTKQQKGGTYVPTDFKQTLMTQAKKWGMLVEGSKDEMKSGATEILVLSRLKDIPQAPPQDFQELPVIIANGVEYVLLNQLVDFMKKKPDDRNVIHEALHDVTAQALAGKDLITYRVRSVDDDVVCGTPLWDEMFMAALHRLSIATSEVDRNRLREEGWKLVAREADVALHAADGHASAGEEIVRTTSIVRSPINTMSTEEIEEEDVFNEWTMTKQQRERGFEDSSLPIDFEHEIEET